MSHALAEARAAASEGEVPVGAAIAIGDELVATGRNRREADADPTAHAEIVALRAAAKAAGGWRLEDATIAVTLEPCPMCAGALVAARVRRLVYGAADPKGGAALSLYNLVQDPRLNHELELAWGIREEECARLLVDFFEERRRS